MTNSPSTNALDAGSFIIHTWGIKEGLPQSSVISLTQTRDGYLWLGTLNGLVRFNGVTFTVFDEANTPGLGGSRIVRVFEDSRSDLWLGTETAGVALVREGVVANLGIGDGGREGRLMSICEDSGGAVWLYTANGKLYRYRDGRLNAARLGSEFYSATRVLAAEKDGPLWVGTQGVLFQLASRNESDTSQLPPVENAQPMQVDFLLAAKNGGCWRLADGRVQFWVTNRLVRDLGDYPWRADAPPATACEDERGNLIVGTLGDGVYWFDAVGGFTRISSTNGLSHDWVLSLCLDDESSLWVGTDGGGLNRVRRSSFSVVPESRKSVVQSVSADGEGGLWMGLNGEGAVHQKNGESRGYGFAEGLFNLNVWSVFMDNRQRLWAGTWGGLYLFDDETGFFRPAFTVEALQQSVLAIHQDRGGRLWFGTQHGLVCWDEREWKTYTTRDGLSSDAARAIADDGSGGIWVGTVGGGLNRLGADKIETFRKSQTGLPSDDISSLLLDGDGVLWVGTFGSGLARFHNGKWTRYTTRDGLCSNGIGYLVEDGEGFLWIGSNSGLMRISKKSLNEFATGGAGKLPVRIYGEDDGLPTRECTQGSQPGACRTADGRLWFPTIKGLVSVDAERLSPNPNPPPVVIESVLVSGSEQMTNALRVMPAGKIVIPPRREQLEIHYTSLNLAAADRARFSYRMDGYETDWLDAGDSRVARYSKLPPGDYTFMVRARNEDGVESREPAMLAV
ncbi:MAG TPA: two-component regulator propeller domain-containing protein, partial [Verrucomicrobiota bacterium]|nr:two-component regulator propeller domain-containing protein [Verrucomicrobiota bacterium]